MFQEGEEIMKKGSPIGLPFHWKTESN